MSLFDLAQTAGQLACDQFGRDAHWLVAAPGRVNLIGEHVDYNDGFVLPMAIDRHVVIAASPNGQRVMRLRSTAVEGEATIDLDRPIEPTAEGQPAWSNYVRGVVAGFVSKLNDGQSNGAAVAAIPGLDCVIHSDLSRGGGLSSSAALEVAKATLLEAVTGHTLEPVEKALLCQKAEHDFAGVPCGIMDQFASVLAKADHLMLIDCRSRHVQHVPFNNPDVRVMVIDTCVQHELTDGGYAARREQCDMAATALGFAALRDATLQQVESAADVLNPVQLCLAYHVVIEITRTIATAEALRRGDWSTVGQHMYESHESLRDKYTVSCAELDHIVDTGRSIGDAGGVIGCRMTGGGFGGCAIALVRRDAADDVAAEIEKSFQAAFGHRPDIFTTRPVRGAHVVVQPS